MTLWTKSAALKVQRSEVGLELVWQWSGGYISLVLLYVVLGGFWLSSFTPVLGYLEWAVCAVLMPYYWAVRTQYRLEHPSGQLEVVSHYLLRRRTLRYPLSALEHIAFEEVAGTNAEGGYSPMYTVSLHLKDGTVVSPTDTSNFQAGKRELAEVLEREIVQLRSAA